MINKSPTEELLGILWISQEPMVGPKSDGSAGEIVFDVIDVAMERRIYGMILNLQTSIHRGFSSQLCLMTRG